MRFGVFWLNSKSIIVLKTNLQFLQLIITTTECGSCDVFEVETARLRTSLSAL